MTWLKRFHHRVSTSFSKRRLEQEMADEMREHLEERAERHIQAGMSPDEARYAAQRSFGGLDQIKERCRDERGGRWLHDLLEQVRHALRRLCKTPGFTITALATFAICLGANLAIFAVVDAILVRPLPVAEAGRLVTVFDCYPRAGMERADIASIASCYDRRGAIPAFASLSMCRDLNVVIGAAGAQTCVAIGKITPEFFTTLGVPLAKGRAFTEEEMTLGADTVAVLTDGFWRDYFAAAPDVVGQTFFNDGVTTTVVGVLPPGFHFLSNGAQFYRPMSHRPEALSPWARHNANGGLMIARLAPGATLADAQAQMDAFNVRQLTDDPLAKDMKDAGYRTVVLPLRADYVRSVRPMLVLLQIGVLFLLNIGALNLVNLLLIRAYRRRKEIAVRQALGAGRGHLVLDALVETTLLALGGGFLGLLLGAAGIHCLNTLGTDRLPLGTSIVFDGRVAVAALVVAIVFGALLAVPIIGIYLRTRIASGLQSESLAGTAGRGAQNLRQGLIVAQVAFAFVLLAGAGLLGVSLKRVLEAPVGFNARGVLTGRITLPEKRYPDDAAQLEFVERLLSVLRATPGVEGAAINTALPFAGFIPQGVVSIEGGAPMSGGSLMLHNISGATSGYWRLMGIPLLQGRLLEDADNHRKVIVCVVDRAFADHYWPGENPLGHRLAFGPSFSEDGAITVVGVVASVKQHELTENPGQSPVYVPFSYAAIKSFSVVLRSGLPESIMASVLQKAVHRLDPGQPVEDIQSMQTRIDDTLVARRSPAIVAGLFAAIALLLAAIGIYGVLSYAVAQRRREIAVRIALGAQAAQIGRQFLRAGLRLIVAGSFLGFLGAWAAGRGMQSLLFGIPAHHPGTLAGAALIVVTVASAASFFPVRRATKIDPLIALRAE
jgi:predicted permease